MEELFKLWSPLYETYVALVEDLINDGFTRHQRDEDLSYGKNIIEAVKGLAALRCNGSQGIPGP